MGWGERLPFGRRLWGACGKRISWCRYAPNWRQERRRGGSGGFRDQRVSCHASAREGRIEREDPDGRGLLRGSAREDHANLRHHGASNDRSRSAFRLLEARPEAPAVRATQGSGSNRLRARGLSKECVGVGEIGADSGDQAPRATPNPRHPPLEVGDLTPGTRQLRPEQSPPRVCTPPHRERAGCPFPDPTVREAVGPEREPGSRTHEVHPLAPWCFCGSGPLVRPTFRVRRLCSDAKKAFVKAQFLEGKDLLVFTENRENPLGGRPVETFLLRVACTEHVIARKVGPSESRAWTRSSPPVRPMIATTAHWALRSAWRGLFPRRRALVFRVGTRISSTSHDVRVTGSDGGTSNAAARQAIRRCCDEERCRTHAKLASDKRPTRGPRPGGKPGPRNDRRRDDHRAWDRPRSRRAPSRSNVLDSSHGESLRSPFDRIPSASLCAP
jgi:hypothetical protein